jgi:parvulin-like peptidyl-prolyl isomerase
VKAAAGPALLLAGAVLFAWGGACTPSSGGPTEPDVVATVNGEPIAVSSLQKAMKRAQHDDENLTPRTEEDSRALAKQLLSDLVDQALLLQTAKALSIRVEPERVDRALLRLRAEYPGATFDQALAEGGQTLDELREQLKRQLTIEAYFSAQVFARVTVSQGDVEAYFKLHEADLNHPELVHALQLVVDDQETARKVQAALHKNERFEELARKYSKSPDAKVGGDLGWFARGQMPEVFDQVCFSLQKGQVSDVVPSSYGFHLFKVLDKKPAAAASLADSKAQVEAQLKQERQAEAQRAKLDELRQKAKLVIHEDVLATVR